MDQKMIPPRPWRVDDRPYDWRGRRATDPAIVTIDGAQVLRIDDGVRGEISRETAELIVRLVNAEPEIVAALEAAEGALLEAAYGVREDAHALVRAALAKVRP